MRALVMTLAALALSGCGDAGGAAGKDQAGTASAWPATDACKALGSERAARIMGSALTGSELSGVVQMAPNMAAMSMCQFQFANGETLNLLLRESPYDDATPDEIERARTMDGTMPPARDIAGLGKLAMWTDRPAQLQVFVDERRRIIVTLAPNGKAGLDQARAVAEAVM